MKKTGTNYRIMSKKLVFGQILVNRGERLWSPAKIKGANKDVKIHDVGRSTTVYNLSFCLHTPCMIYIIKTFLLISSSVSGKQRLCFVHGQGQKWKQKHTTKNFVEFHNHSPLLTMVKFTWNLRFPWQRKKWWIHNWHMKITVEDELTATESFSPLE